MGEYDTEWHAYFTCGSVAFCLCLPFHKDQKRRLLPNHDYVITPLAVMGQPFIKIPLF